MPLCILCEITEKMNNVSVCNSCFDAVIQIFSNIYCKHRLGDIQSNCYIISVLHST